MLHKNDHKRLRSEQFLRFTIILYITFTKQPPIVISYHFLLILFLLTAFKVQYILVEALTMFVRVHSHILFEFLKISIKDMDSERHPTAHCAVVLHQNLNQLCIVFVFLIAQEALNHCETVPGHFLLPSWILGGITCIQGSSSSVV